jgi:hypothetical protein
MTDELRTFCRATPAENEDRRVPNGSVDTFFPSIAGLDRCHVEKDRVTRGYAQETRQRLHQLFIMPTIGYEDLGACHEISSYLLNRRGIFTE